MCQCYTHTHTHTHSNCVHRDLAARNILVRDDGENKKMLAKVADFGLSRSVSQYGTMSVFCCCI